MTKVCFRVEKDGGILAVFPYMKTRQAGVYVCYSHVGQHGHAAWEYVRYSTRPAYSCEYMELLRELKRVGYTDLKVLERLPGYYAIENARIMED